jgi:lysophospholipase L1-like esterase
MMKIKGKPSKWIKLGLSIIMLLMSVLFFYRFSYLPSKTTRTALNPADIIPSYNFVEYQKNQLQFPGGKAGFETFYTKLDSLTLYGQGRVNILHIGGSHVQAGTLSGRMRENMYTLADGIKGDRGFLFPFSMAQTNSPRNFKVAYTGNWEGCRCALKKNHCPWGLSGITATTYDTLTSVKLYAFDKDSVCYSFNKVSIYHLATPESYQVRLDSSFVVDSVYTDSLVGVTVFELGQYYDTLYFETVKTDSLQSYFVLQGINMETEQAGLTYTAIGVNGASVPAYLRCQYFEAQLNTIPPDLVIFGIGINDSYMPESQFSQEEFEQNYRDLMQVFRTVNPDVQFLFMSNNDSYYKRRFPNPNIFKVRQAMINLSTEYGAAYWDLFDVMGGLNSIRLWEKEGLAKVDKVHFTPAGYLLNADLLFKAFRDSYGDHLSQLNATAQKD